ncbi:diacylglycerol/lipid kinase family protein [Puniceibacterium confluentis]|uniref:diacylglycerol/lipid kinase family protein n=1 Tax=Puniceibacterium confluentis TaxID=1958944 RepID=UPI0011B556F7|nr:diacylglycerol kinase family protein [Puniceibacterium confluentis]
MVLARTHAGLKAPPPTADTSICVLMNERAGSDDKQDVADQLETAFARYPGRFELRVMGQGSGVADSCARAMKDGFGTIVAVGGDGTVTGIAGQLAGTGRRMGIIPQGTFNFVARGLGIPEDIAEAVDLIASGKSRPYAVGEVNGEIFLNNASLGIYPQILKEREGTYRRWGRSRLAAHWSVLWTFLSFRTPVRMKVRVGGQVIRAKTPLAFVARSAFQLEHYGLDGAECIRNGEFALFLLPDVTRWELLLRALRLAGKGMKPERDFELFCGTDIEIETTRGSQLVAMDGERVRLASPLRFRMHADALHMIAPDNSAGL